MESKGNEEKIRVFVRIKPITKPPPQKRSTKSRSNKPQRIGLPQISSSPMIPSSPISKPKNADLDFEGSLLSGAKEVSGRLLYSRSANKNVGSLKDKSQQKDVGFSQLISGQKCLEDVKGQICQTNAPLQKISHHRIKNTRSGDIFEYDNVFDVEQTNVDLFQKIILENMEFIMNGNNFSVFMYGQTSSGKTHTMNGSNKGGINFEVFGLEDAKPKPAEAPLANSKTFDSTRPNANQLNKGNRFLSPQKFSKTRLPKVNGQFLSPMKPFTRPAIIAKNICQREIILQNDQMANAVDPKLISPDTKDDNEGLVQLTLREIFRRVKSRSECMFKINLSYVELYNENIYDLFSSQTNRVGLDLFENENGKVMIKNINEPEVKTFTEAMQWYYKGESTRIFASTSQNHNSSRSHVVFKVMLDIRYKSRPYKIYNSNIVLADLAGSEALSRDQGKELRFKEGTLINKSLLSLSNVVTKLRNATSHISFRESKLTRILQPTLTGNSRTAVVCTIATHPENLLESLSTLRFGVVAKGIKYKLRIGSDSKPDYRQDNAFVEDLTQQIKSLEEDKYHLSKERDELKLNANNLESENQSVKEQLASCEDQIQSLNLFIDNLKKTNSDLRAYLDSINREILHSQEANCTNSHEPAQIAPEAKTQPSRSGAIVEERLPATPYKNDSKENQSDSINRRITFSKSNVKGKIVEEGHSYRKIEDLVMKAAQFDNKITSAVKLAIGSEQDAVSSSTTRGQAQLISNLQKIIDKLSTENDQLRQIIKKLEIQLRFRIRKSFSGIKGGDKAMSKSKPRLGMDNSNCEECNCNRQAKRINNQLTTDELLRKNQELEKKLAKFQKDEEWFLKREFDLKDQLSKSKEQVFQMKSLIQSSLKAEGTKPVFLVTQGSESFTIPK
jgi:hypothetical protein